MAGERKRRHHQRSRNGCLTCKKRHMRCDETKPFCRNCLKHGGSCGYPGEEALNLDTPSRDVIHTQLYQCSPIIDNVFGAARSDPFNSLRIEMSPDSYKLFDHCYKIVPFTNSFLSSKVNNYRILVRSPTVKKPGGEMFDFAVSDEGLTHCAILLAADHFMLLGGSRTIAMSVFYQHKVEAIRIVNERLSNPELATADGTVGTVACLTLAEATNGNLQAATSHLNGLEHLVKLRGDLHSKTMGGLLQRVVLLADSLTTAATHSPQRFLGQLSTVKGSSRRCSDRSIYETPNLAGQDIWYGSSPPLFQAIECLDLETMEMFRNLHNLSGQITARLNGTLVLNEAGLLDNICKAERHIESLIHDRGDRRGATTTSDDESTIIQVRSAALAGAIYLYLFLRGISVDSSIFDWMVALLKEDFQSFDSEIGRLYPEEVLFWILFVGRAAAVGRDERYWFCARLDMSRRDLMLSSWEEAKSVLGRFAWIEGPADSEYRELWEELDGTTRY